MAHFTLWKLTDHAYVQASQNPGNCTLDVGDV